MKNEKDKIKKSKTSSSDKHSDKKDVIESKKISKTQNKTTKTGRMAKKASSSVKMGKTSRVVLDDSKKKRPSPVRDSKSGTTKDIARRRAARARKKRDAERKKKILEMNDDDLVEAYLTKQGKYGRPSRRKFNAFYDRRFKDYGVETSKTGTRIGSLKGMYKIQLINKRTGKIADKRVLIKDQSKYEVRILKKKHIKGLKGGRSRWKVSKLTQRFKFSNRKMDGSYKLQFWRQMERAINGIGHNTEKLYSFINS